MAAIEACRTPVLGGHVEQCGDCGLVRCAYNSCRNRHCPKCQGMARAEWLEARQAELLPVPYFHVVFTLPPAAAEIAFQNKAGVYAILMRTAAETLVTIAADPRHLGAELGVTAVLHTWGQTLQHHPHVHFAWCPAAAPHSTASAGSPAGKASFCRCGSCRASSDACSSQGCAMPLKLTVSSSAAISPSLGSLPPSQDGSTRYAASIGSSTPSRPSADPSRCSPISAAIPIASPSPTAGSCRSRTATYGSPGRIIATAPRPRAWRLKQASSSAASSSTRCRTASIAFVTMASWPMAPAPSASADVVACSISRPSPTRPRSQTSTTAATASSPGATSPSAPTAVAPCSASPSYRARPRRRFAATPHEPASTPISAT